MNRTRARIAAAFLGTLLLVVPGAAQGAALPRHATATLRDGSGETVGWALVSEAGPRGLRVVVIAFGLTPGLHGLHVHTTGSCVAPAFASAGGHFNPLGVPHGSHAGDLPDLVVNQAGIGFALATTATMTLAPGPLSLFDGDGSAIVVHANADDHITDPSGNSGPRIACGALARRGI